MSPRSVASNDMTSLAARIFVTVTCQHPPVNGCHVKQENDPSIIQQYDMPSATTSMLHASLQPCQSQTDANLTGLAVRQLQTGMC